MMRFLPCALAVGLVRCSTKPPAQTSIGREQAREALMAHAQQTRQAMLRQDYRRMADLTHSAVVNGLGGRARFIQHLDEFAAEMKGGGFGVADMVLSEPSELVESRGSVYAVVPFDAHLTGPGGTTGVKPSYLIGVSADGGAGWTFVDGEGLRGDRATLLSVLPDFPDRLALPAYQDAQWVR
jgi:hypothetical protein